MKNRYGLNQRVRLLLVALTMWVLAPVAAQAQLSESQIVPADVMENDLFGDSIVMDGNRVLVGVRLADLNNVENTGAAYVFERIDGQWVEVQKLTASNPSERDFFGESVALEGDRLFIGAMGNDDREQEGGAVYFYERVNGQWEQAQILYPDDPQDFHGFGWEIALEGDRVFISAPQDEEVEIQAGAVYVFEWDDDEEEWVQVQKILPDNDGNASFFGTTMGLDGDRLLVGSPTDDTAADAGGAAYIFQRNRGTNQWERVQKLLPPPVALPDSLENDTFAREVALEGDWAFASSFDDEVCLSKPLFDPNKPNSCVSGAVFAFQRQSNNTWQFKQKIAPEELDQFDYFGTNAIASEGNYVVIGSRGDDDACPDPPPPKPLFCDTGAAYLFELVGDEWVKVDKFTASDADSLDFLGGAIFSQGRPLSISGSHIAVGAPTVPLGQNPEPRLGAAYIFKFMNQDPLAEDDQANTPQNTAVEIDVLANDSDPDADALTVSVTAGPSNGSVTINGGTLTYTPDGGFAGVDQLTYTASDGDGGTDEASVSITVISITNAPSAPTITTPADGATVAVGGTPQSPLPKDTPFIVEWSASTDPNGDDVTYTWELADADDFGTVLVSAETGMETRFETTLGALDALLVQRGIAIGASLTLYHRAIASDGSNSTEGPAAEVRLIRAVLTATDDEAEVPREVALFQNYPNPFNPATQITFALPQATHARLTVFDVLGRAVAVLVDERLPAGRHEAVFEAGDLPSGVYLYQLEAGGRMLTRTMLLMK